MKLKILFSTLTITILALFFSCSLFAQSSLDDERLEGLEKDIEQLMESYNAVGLSVSIVENDQTIYSNGFGYRDLENKKEVDKNTAFPIASCSKAFTATVLGMLEAEGALALQDKPNLYVPKLEFYNAKMDNSITITDLLSHKSGLGNINGTLVLFPEDDRLKVAQKLKYIKPEGEVKESSIYSNMGYTLAGTVVEQVTGENWETNIHFKIFEPLEMYGSFTDQSSMFNSNNYAYGYGQLNGKTKKVIYEQYHDYKPAGGIRSTATDMSHWMLAWLNKGVFNNKEVIPAEYIIKARKAHNTREETYNKTAFLHAYGLGWRVESNDGDFKVYHGGNTSGFSSVVMTYPFRGLGITVLCNQDDSILPYIVADVIKNRMLGKSTVPLDAYPVSIGDIYSPDQIKEELNSHNPPTKSLSSFNGVYDHNGYGEVEIRLEEGNLFAIFPTYKFQLEHLYHDVFILKPLEDISDVFNPEFPVNFLQDGNGQISSFRIGLQSAEKVEFMKRDQDE